MENVDTSENIKALLLKCFDFVLSSLCAFGIVAIIELHFFVPFFPVLFLFDFLFLVRISVVFAIRFKEKMD